jgi:hypothetical protein
MLGYRAPVFVFTAAAFIVWVIVRAWGFPTPVFVFTVAACVAWAMTLGWTLKQGKRGRRYVVLLGLATVFWWLGESLAIRLGKYEYPQFPLRVPLPWGGTPNDPGPLTEKLRLLVPLGEGGTSGCVAGSWDIPFPVVAIEAALLFALLRIAVLRLKSDKGDGVPAALATAGLSALLMVNVTAVLDPVVSKTKWCEAATISNPNYHGLSFGLWQWFTNETHPGYWFGVPLINYAAWFLAIGSFNFLLRWEIDGPQGIVWRYTKWYAYPALLVLLVIVFIILIPLKVLIEKVLVHGQDYLFDPHPIFYQGVWQFGVIALLLALGFLLLIRFGRPRPNPEFDWISSVPQLLVFAFCLVALLVQPHAGIFAVWVVTTAIASAVIFWPSIARFIDRKKRVEPQDEVSLHGH